MGVRQHDQLSKESLFQLYHDVIEMRGEMVCKFDAETRLLQVNEAYARAFGKSPEELLGRRFTSLVPESEHESIFRHLAALKAKKHEVMYEHQVLDQHGNKVWQEWCDRAIFNPDGSLSHYISVGRSINRRKHLEKQLKQKHAAESLIARVAKNLVNAELNELNSAITQALGEIGAYTDAGRVYVHQYDFEKRVFSNTHEWCAAGLEPSRPQLQNIELDLVQEWLEQHKRGERVFIPDTRSDEVETKLRNQLQRRGISSLLMLPLIKNGSCLGCLGVDVLDDQVHWSTSVLTVMDVLAEVITNAIERINYEAELIQARDEARQATKEKGSFIATMSHEIRNPLNGVLGMVEMLRKTELTPEQQHMLRALSSSGTMLLDIVNQASELEKIEQKTLTLSYSNIVLEDLIDEIKLIFEERLNQKQLAFRFQNDTKAVDGRLRGAYLPLKQVLVNLVGNAIKFTEQGEISITAKHLESQDAAAGKLHISVEDTGPGIAEEDIEGLFSPYVQLDEPETRKEGYGLGLSISKQLVQKMHGKIGVDSRRERARGARFWIEIPVVPPAEKPAVPAAQPQTAKAGPAPEKDAAPANPVLLMARPDAGIHVLRRQLEVLEIEYDFCSSVEEAETRFNSSTAAYEYLLADLNLGQPAVLKIISQLKNRPAWWDLNVILLAHMAGELDPDWPQSYDIAQMLVKPLSNKQLTALFTGEAEPEPLAPAAMHQHEGASAAEAPAGENSSYPALKVLVAEDNEVNQMLIRFILDKLGLQKFEIVPNGARAVEELKSQHYDLILMDCQMPVMDGFEASRNIRQLHDSRKAGTPIVAVTAFATREYNRRCFDAGMDKYITKPYTLSNIKELLDELTTSGMVPEKTAAQQHSPAGERPAAGVSPAIDTELLSQRFGGDQALINTMMEQFIDDGFRQVAALRAQLEAKSWQDFYDTNHQLKGAAATMSATALFETSEQLEKLAEQWLRKPPAAAETEQAEPFVQKIQELFNEVARRAEN